MIRILFVKINGAVFELEMKVSANPNALTIKS